MNFSALPELLLAWMKTQGAALLQGNKAEQASPFRVGAEYEGKVLDQLPTGRHLVQVAGQKLDMGLPRNTQTGDTVRLTFLNGGVRPTFLLNNQAPVTPAQQVQISNTAQQVSALMRFGQQAQPPVQAPSQLAGQAAAPVSGQLAEQAAGQMEARPPGQVVTQPPAQAPLAVPLPSAPASPQVPIQQPLTAAPDLTQTPSVAAQARVLASSQAIQTLPGQQNPAVAQAAATARPIAGNVVMLQGNTAAMSNEPTAVASANTA
jgi:hypothetical protein